MFKDLYEIYTDKLTDSPEDKAIKKMRNILTVVLTGTVVCVTVAIVHEAKNSD